MNMDMDNLSSFESLETDGTIKNFEEIILKLEEEKDELKNTLKAKINNISAKLAEDRRKRLRNKELFLIRFVGVYRHPIGKHFEL